MDNLNFTSVQNNAGLPAWLALTTPGALITKVLPYVFGAAGILLLIYLVLGGLQLILSRGEPKAVQAAQAKITNAVIGLVIIVIAYSLVALLGTILGIGPFANIFTGVNPSGGR